MQRELLVVYRRRRWDR